MTLKVLIADDHALIAEALRLVIDGEPDMEVVGQAHDGEQAVLQCIELRPDVALMDNAMPFLNGIAATRMLRQRCPETRVIMLSMYGDNANVLRALRAGASAYLLKSSVANELIEAIRTVGAGQRYLSAELSSGVIERLLQSPEDPLDRLSTREHQVLQMMAEGRTTAEIAEHLKVSPKTVETYRTRMMEKAGLHDIAGVVKFAIQQGVITLDS